MRWDCVYSKIQTSPVVDLTTIVVTFWEKHVLTAIVNVAKDHLARVKQKEHIATFSTALADALLNYPPAPINQPDLFVMLKIMCVLAQQQFQRVVGPHRFAQMANATVEYFEIKF